ncbi:3-isopropylmalate dehydratase small subunit [Devosia sp. A369]
MRPFQSVTSRAHVLLRDSVDTDMIIRIERLVLVSRRELGRYVFEMLRSRADGTPDPDHPLNAPDLRGAEILIAGRNFGCGSSREAAVWALAGFGIRVIIAPSFGDIFRSNCIKNGILPVALQEDACRDLAASAQSLKAITVDLESGVISLPAGSTQPFSMRADERESLLRGEDEIALTSMHTAAIEAHFRKWQEAAPWASLDRLAMDAFIRSTTSIQGKQDD